MGNNDHVAEQFRSILQGVDRVSDFRVDKVEMRAADYWALPADARRLIEAYASKLYEHADGRVTFEIAIYRWEEIQRQ